MKKKNLIISVDGPAGSGKERIAKYIAKKYKLYHLDSGILYRRIAKFFIDENIEGKNSKEIKEKLEKIKKISPRSHKSLRKENLSKFTSKLAKKGLIRDFINQQQKIIVSNKLKIYRGCIIDGRDIGSKVFKKAKIKLFIEVKAEIRAKRRHKQLIELGEKSIYSDILKEINLRDKTDINRKDSPLVVPIKAFLINNSESFRNTINQINKILSKIK